MNHDIATGVVNGDTLVMADGKWTDQVIVLRAPGSLTWGVTKPLMRPSSIAR